MEATAATARLSRLEKDWELGSADRRELWEHVSEIERRQATSDVILEQVRDDVRALKRWAMAIGIGLLTTGGSLIVGLLVGGPK